jgi:O-antigen/teichoic acid export membrane protein
MREEHWMMQTVKSYITDTIFRFFSELIPLFIVTYTAHVLGEEAFGVQTWSYAVVTMVLAVFTVGIRTFARTELAKIPADKARNTRFFWAMYLVQLGVLVLVGIGLLVFIILSKAHYQAALLAQLWLVVAAALDISWFFAGINKMRIVVRRNALTQMLRFILLILVVKSAVDLEWSILLIALTSVFANVLLWFRLPTALIKLPLRHLFVGWQTKGLLLVVLTTLIPQMVLQGNKVLLGLTAGIVSAGLYYSAEVLVKVGLALVLGLGVAMMEFVNRQRQANDAAAVQRSFYIGLEAITAISILLAVGVAQVGPEVVYWFLGTNYGTVGTPLHILAFLIPLVGWRYGLALQQMAAEKGFRDVAYQVQIGAFVNLVLMLTLIPSFGLAGAAWSAVIAEATALVIQVWLLRRNLQPTWIVRVVWKYVVAGVVTYFELGAIINWLFDPWPKNTFVEAVMGLIVYVIVLIVLQSPVLETSRQTYRWLRR